MGGTPILILKEGTKREKGKGAQQNNIAAARMIADMVRSSLGPRGMDKMLVNNIGDVTITNDGVTILKEMDVQHPAAKMMIEVSKAQDEECGDGTTTAAILAGEFLKKSLDLIDSNVHPTIIASGYRMATQEALEHLEKLGMNVGVDDEETLKKIAMTSMISKQVSGSREHMANVAVKAVKAVADQKNGKWEVDLDNIQVVKKQGGSMEETQVINGLIIDKQPPHPAMPKKIRNAKIALISGGFEIKKTEIDAKIQIRDPAQMHAFLDEEERMFKKMVDSVKEAGANVVFCQKGMEDLAMHYMAKAGIMGFRRVKKSDMEKLAKATNGELMSNPEDVTADEMGYAELVEVKKIQDEESVFVTGCENPKAVSVLVRGGTEHVVDEIERSLDDAMNVIAITIEDGKMVSGGGSTFMDIAMKVRECAASVGGREQIAIDAWASALEIIPITLAENAGLDPIDILIEMRKAHKGGRKYAGVNVFTGKITDMLKENVIDPLRVVKQALNSSTEAAVMILRIDDVIASKGTERSTPGVGGDGGYGTGMDEG